MSNTDILVNIYLWLIFVAIQYVFVVLNFITNTYSWLILVDGESLIVVESFNDQHVYIG